MNKKLWGSIILLGAGIFTLVFRSWNRRSVRADKNEIRKNEFASALQDMLNQKEKATSFWQGQAKEWIEETIDVPFKDTHLEEFRKSLIYSINQSSESNQMSAKTETLIHEILATIEKPHNLDSRS